MAVRSAEAEWRGDLASGTGTVRSGSGAVDASYSFPSRFEEGAGTNPEELVAAAHAGCFSMALSHGLSQAGHTPIRVHTVARVHLEKGDSGFSITRIELTCEAQVPGIDPVAFQEQVAAAKSGCPVSRLVTGAELAVQASLVDA